MWRFTQPDGQDVSKVIKIKTYGTIILFFVLCGCETWPVVLREERRLRVFENRVLRRLFGLKRDEVTRLHSEELNNVYCSLNITRVIESRII